MAEKILIATDDIGGIRPFDEFLLGWGYEIVSAESFSSARQLISLHPPAIAVIDIALPAGTDLVEEIHRINPDISILVLCHEDTADDVMGALKHLPAEFVTKPVRETALEIAVTRIQRIRKLEAKASLTDRRIEGLAEKLVGQATYTERLLGIRQVVDKMYSFIGQVASDVQGGVKYFNELPYFVSIHSPKGEVLTANPTYLKYLGNRRGKSSWGIYSGSCATFETCPVGLTVRSGQVTATRALVRYGSGAKVPVAAHTAPIYDNDGEIALVLEVFAGSKEIEQLAAEVRTTQQRYQQLFDAVPSHIAVLDRQLRLNASNRKFKEKFGGRAKGRFFDILRPASFPVHRDPVSLTSRNGLPHQGEMVVTAQDGTQYNMMAWTAPITTATGKLVQILVIFADITEVRKLQDNLSSLGLMISTLSHNLKGSLTGLDAGLYLIDKGFYRNNPGRIEEGLDVARLMVERIRKMVFDILHYSKERELNLTTVDVAQFTDEVAANVENKIRGADIEFRCKIEPKLGGFEIDRGLLRSAMINILENAMEACIEDTGKERYRIDFAVRRDRDDLVFEIIDNGCGMTRHQMKNMFTIFYTSKGHQGTGLGLFITDKVIRKHGGSVAVDSEPQRGARFEIRIPQKGIGAGA